jgi:hypothetical protein
MDGILKITFSQGRNKGRIRSQYIQNIMATERQREAARQNIKKAQAARRGGSSSRGGSRKTM